MCNSLATQQARSDCKKRTEINYNSKRTINNMTDEQYLTFQKFNDEGLATELTEVLEQNNIEFIVDDTQNFDPSFSNSEINKEFRVKLKKEDFEKANTLLLEISVKQLENVDKNYYLFKFTDEELIEIVAKADEWSQYDFILAQRILKERGKEIKPELADALRKQRLQELAKPEEGQQTWIYAGYTFALLGGLISIFIGWHLLSYKKTLPNGDRVYGYSASDRKHGNRIFLIGIIFIVFWSIVWIIKTANN